jgi:hypothetical protein
MVREDGGLVVEQSFDPRFDTVSGGNVSVTEEIARQGRVRTLQRE